MKNLFKNKLNKSNPFVDNTEKKGDETNTMTDEQNNNEQENLEQKIVEDVQEEQNQSEEKAQEEDFCETDSDKLKQDLENLNNQYIRLAADFENYRKRQAQEREALLKYGAEECMKKVIEVADNFDRALDMVEKIDNVEKMKETFFILNKQLTESLTKLGLEQIKSVGETFNPNLHEAVMQTQTEEYPEDTVIRELQKGYKMGEKVLRPAMVAVAVK